MGTTRSFKLADDLRCATEDPITSLMSLKRLLLHYPVLKVGGAEMSTLRLVSALADRGWRVTLVVTTGGGKLEPAIDDRVRLVRLRPRAAGNRFRAAVTTAQRVAAIPDLLAYALFRCVGIVRMLSFIFSRYDAAALLLMGAPSRFVRKFVRANVKAIWIRNDVRYADPTGSVVAALRTAVSQIDYFICVSQTARDSLVSALPEAHSKAIVIYNILDAERIRALAQLESAPPIMTEDGPTRILTVCRLREQAKGLLRMVSVGRRLAELGHSFRWYVVGDGPDRERMQEAIHDVGLSDRMFLLGNIANPFPAYVAADVVAVLSYYEGLCGVVNEARVLKKPVLATEVSGIYEQLTDGLNGMIVPQDENAIVSGLSRLLTDGGLRRRLAKGGYPDAILNDAAKLDRLEQIFST